MYVKITNGNVNTYPYSIGQLRRDNPNISFPKVIPEAKLSKYGMYKVLFLDKPSIDERTQKVEQQTVPTYVNSSWCIGWDISNKTSTEVQAYDDSIAESNRVKRSDLLVSSDWTQLTDTNVDSSSWATYRQALRDITSHANWPHLEDSDWPTKP